MASAARGNGNIVITGARENNLKDITVRVPGGGKAWVVTGVSGSGKSSIALDGSTVYTALPSIQADTGASSAAVQWISAAYTLTSALTFALALITGGRLGDLYGRKRTFLAGTGVFTLASLLCGIALASVVFFVHAPAGSHGTTVTGAFAGTIWYVVGARMVMRALIFLLPRRTPRT